MIVLGELHSSNDWKRLQAWHGWLAQHAPDVAARLEHGPVGEGLHKALRGEGRFVPPFLFEMLRVELWRMCRKVPCVRFGLDNRKHWGVWVNKRAVITGVQSGVVHVVWPEEAWPTVAERRQWSAKWWLVWVGEGGMTLENRVGEVQWCGTWPGGARVLRVFVARPRHGPGPGVQREDGQMLADALVQVLVQCLEQRAELACALETIPERERAAWGRSLVRRVVEVVARCQS